MDGSQGVYICTGCGIGEAIDAEKLEKVAISEHSARVVRREGLLCGPDALDRIRNDIESERLDRIVVCACSMRACTDRFDFGRSTMVERVNVREHVAWTQEPRTEDADMLAQDYLRMGIVRSLKSEPLSPYDPGREMSRTILVVGGGMTGMTAALAAARAGYRVVLVEKGARLGGEAALLLRQLPTRPPWTDLEDPGVERLASMLEAHENVTVKLQAEILGIEGGPCLFDLALRTPSGEETIRAGAIVLATGHLPYDPGNLSHLGYGTSRNVVTSADLERMAREGRIVRSDGMPARSVVFVQCAGSRDPLHLPYCSALCCLASLRQASYVRSLDPEATATILYRDIRTPGLHEHFYGRAQDDEGVFLVRCEVRAVTPGDGGTVTVEADDTFLGEPIRLEADLVVLASGIVPRAREALRLGYRLGQDCPEGKYGFPDSDFICFPYETRRTGIYAAGTVRRPMDPCAARDDAIGAALKAIQCIEVTARGAAVHPRALDISIPEFLLERCTQCKRCIEECPFGALDEDPRGTPVPNPTRCRRCGICMGSCPERIVSFGDFGVDMVASMIKACEVPPPEDGKPRVLGLVCENDAYPVLDMAGASRLGLSPFIRFIPVRCLGSVNVVWITQALDRGFDGIVLLGCRSGDDTQCHFISGSELCKTRMKNVGEKLEQMALEPERVQLHEIAANEHSKLKRITDGFVETIVKVGPNPFKGL